MSAEKSKPSQPRKQTYIDANLLFEISYPETWARTQKPVTLAPLSKETTTWHVDYQDGKELLLELSVLSLPAELNSDGFSGLETMLTEQNSDVLFSTSEDVLLPAGPARKLTGKSQVATFATWLYLGKQRHYIISCSAATPVFEQYRKLFSQIADSFMSLE